MQNTSSFVSEYVGNFRNQEAIPGIEWEYKTLQAILPQLTLNMINKQVQQYITDKNILIT
jgi:zinc protease